ncbi:NTP transferase domain-containing protein, partial [Candidatus Peregrinibacteria bacterium]|nr:NTP transferase domain-containing protein [Candidatus Peregrinibacteria bacterium]
MYHLTIKTLLLAAGSSRRFWPLQEKCRLLICGKTLLEHQMDRLKAGGCDDIICIVGTHNQEWVREISPIITTVTQGEEEGMRGALIAALPLCKNEPVLIVGNDFIEADAYGELRENFSSHSHLQGILFAREVTEYFPGGYLTLDKERITAITEKPGEGMEPSNLVNIVAHLHRDASLLLHALQTMPMGGDDGYERALCSLFPRHHYAALPYRGTWFPLKYPWHPLPILSSLLEDSTTQTIHPSDA